MAVRIFSNGTQFSDWQVSNCDRCTKGASVCLAPGDWPTCTIEAELVKAYFDTGCVPDEIAARAGVSDEQSYVWMCSEVVWTEEWKRKACNIGCYFNAYGECLRGGKCYTLSDVGIEL